MNIEWKFVRIEMLYIGSIIWKNINKCLNNKYVIIFNYILLINLIY